MREGALPCADQAADFCVVGCDADGAHRKLVDPEEHANHAAALAANLPQCEDFELLPKATATMATGSGRAINTTTVGPRGHA